MLRVVRETALFQTHCSTPSVVALEENFTHCPVVINYHSPTPQPNDMKFEAVAMWECGTKSLRDREGLIC